MAEIHSCCKIYGSKMAVHNILQFEIIRKICANSLFMTNFLADRTMCYHQKRIYLYVQCATLWANKHMLSTITTEIRLRRGDRD